MLIEDREWNRERIKRNPSFFYASLRAFWLPFLYSGISLTLEIAYYTTRPLIMEEILKGFQEISVHSGAMRAITYGTFLIMSSALFIFLRSNTFWWNYRAGLRLRVGTGGLVYKKTFLFLHYLWIGPLQILLVFWMMSKITVIPSLCSICVLVFFIPVQVFVNKIYGRIRSTTAKVTDDRIRILSDLIGGIRVIKVHAWESIFTKMVHHIRRRETKLFWLSRICQAFEFTQLVYQIRLAMVALLVAAVLQHEGPGDPIILRSFYIFTLFSYIGSLFISVTLFMPLSIQTLFDTKLSCKRIMSFLLIPEHQDDRKPTIMESDEPMVQFIEVNAKWSKNGTKNTLDNISFEIRGPQIVGIVGSVGSGKSSLLQAVLGELPVSEGFVFRSPNVAYAPQVAWVFAGTVRENILCDLPFDEQRYEAVLKATTLDVDLAGLPLGDQTQVGERGISMSGGQKARIGLARVAYSQSPFVLLDDPLAAVDARVSNHLFDKCIRNYLSDRLRLLVTHQHQLLPQMDKIIVIKEGKIEFFGTYDEMVSQGIDTFRLISNPPSREGSIRTLSLSTSFMDSSKPNLSYDDTRALSMSEDENPQDRLDRLWSTSNPKSDTDKGFDESDRFLAPDSDAFADNVDVRFAQTGNHLDKSDSSKLNCLSNYEEAVTRSGQSSEIKSNRAILSRQSSKKQPNSCLHDSSNISSRHSILPDGPMLPESMAIFTDDPDKIDHEDKPLTDKQQDLLKNDANLEASELKEHSSLGAVALRNYVVLTRLGGGFFGFVATLLLFALTITNMCFCDVWVAQWSSMVDERSLINRTEPSNVSSIIRFQDNYTNMYIYCGLVGTLVILSTTRTLSFFALLLNSAKVLHKRMLSACLRTRIKFFEINPAGRILNRFANDLGMIDELLPQTTHDFLSCSFVVLGLTTVTFVSNFWVLIPTIPLLFALWYYRRYYLFTSRQLKRIETVALSPVYSSVNVTLQGLPCIRASRSQATQLNKFYQLTNTYTNVHFSNIAAQHWLSFRLDFLCLLFLTCVVVISILLGVYSSIPGASVGLMITYASNLIGLFQWCVRLSAEVENQMVSVERAVEYMDLEPEHLALTPIESPPENWPDQGHVVFENFWLRYKAGGTWALKGINLNIRPGSKVGVVGRTGAGKSSLISAIFRLVESDQGTIIIDGIDIRHLHLQELRKRISIIPQDPIMFTGTVRTNLDPDEIYSEETIWKALSAVQLEKLITSLENGLDSSISEGGSNFSTGQRQLLALARAILGGNRILVVDEATANVDPITDSIIQQTLRQKFGHCTVLTVAHRLHTVIDNDMIVVMENGSVVEFGTPHELLNPKLAKLDATFASLSKADRSHALDSDPITGTSCLANLVRQTGPDEARFLARLARKAFFKNNRLRNQD